MTIKENEYTNTTATSAEESTSAGSVITTPNETPTNKSGKPKVLKLSEAEKFELEERRIEINYLRHLKRKYPDDDKRISFEISA